MFDLFRSRDKAVRYLLGALLGLVALSMVVTLIPGYGTPTTASEQVVAEIGGEPLTILQVQTALQSVLRNQQIPREMVQHYVPQVIDQMISERAVAYQAERMGFRVTEEDVALAIRSMIGTRLFPTGEFDRDIYARFLAQQGLTVEQFEKNVRTQLLLTKLQSLVLEGSIITPDEIQREYKRRNEQIKLDYVAYTTADLRSEVTVTPEEIQAQYNQNKSTYTIPEKRSFHVLVADEAKFTAATQLNDQELRAFYAGNQDRYRLPERAHVRHILVKTLEKPKEQVAQLEAKAKDLLKQIRAGADFAEIAKKHSEDTGSAVKGGDLEWVTRGQMVKNFENAAFSLKPNEISDVVKTEYGFHIVQVLAREQARVKPFEEVRGEIETERKKEVIYQRMQTAIEQARAELTKNPQQAQQIAEKHGLVYAKADRIGTGESVPEVGSHPELEAALGGLRAGGVTPVVQVAPTRLAIAAVTEVHPPRPAQLAEVDSQIRESITTAKLQRLSEQRIREMTEKFKNAKDVGELAKSIGAQVKTTDFFGREGAAEGIGPATYFADAFTKPVGTLVAPVAIGPQVVLARVAERKEADLSKLAAERESMLLALKRRKSSERKDLFEDGVVTQLIKEGKVKKYQDNIRRLLTSYQG